MKWPIRSISEACSLIVDCPNRTAPVVDYPTPFKMIRTTNVRHGRIDLTDARCVEKATYDHWTRRGVPLQGDVVLTREAPLGEVGMIRGDEQVFLGQRTMMYRADPAIVLPEYLSYCLQSFYVQQQIQSFGKGSTVAHMRVPDAKKLMLPTPDISIQKVICRHLDGLDRAFEINIRRIALLEESARSLYRQWFIQRRFWGHERIRTVNDLPSGWSQCPAQQVIDFNPATRFSKGQIAPFIPMTSLSESSMVIDPIEVREAGGGARFRNGDTLLARITPCLENGKTGYVQFMVTADQIATGSTEFIVMRPKGDYSCWVYCLARTAEFRQHAINSMSGADGRQRVKEEALATLSITWPSTGILQQFEDAVRPMFSQIQVLTSANVRLREARNLLLPRLMDGRISV